MCTITWTCWNAFNKKFLWDWIRRSSLRQQSSQSITAIWSLIDEREFLQRANSAPDIFQESHVWCQNYFHFSRKAKANQKLSQQNQTNRKNTFPNSHITYIHPSLELQDLMIRIPWCLDHDCAIEIYTYEEEKSLASLSSRWSNYDRLVKVKLRSPSG